MSGVRIPLRPPKAPAILAVTLLVLAGLGGWRVWVLHRDLALLRADVEAGINARTDVQLDRFWNHLNRLQEEQGRAVEARVQRVEAAATQIASRHGELARRVGGMEPWVRMWAAASNER